MENTIEELKKEFNIPEWVQVIRVTKVCKHCGTEHTTLKRVLREDGKGFK